MIFFRYYNYFLSKAILILRPNNLMNFTYWLAKTFFLIKNTVRTTIAWTSANASAFLRVPEFLWILQWYSTGMINSKRLSISNVKNSVTHQYLEKLKFTHFCAFFGFPEICALASTLSRNVSLQDIAIVCRLHALTTTPLVNFQRNGEISQALKFRSTNKFCFSYCHRLIFCFDGGAWGARMSTTSAALLDENARWKVENGRISLVLRHNTYNLIYWLTCCLFHCIFRSSSYTHIK